MEYLIEVRGLCKRWPGFTLEGVDLTVPAGAIVGLIGENGAGKTTTLKAILNILRPDGGTLRLLGRDPSDPAAREETAAVLEDSYFYGGLNARQIARSMAGICGSWDDALYRESCERFSLDERKPIRDFSRGMRLKLNLAAALARHPKLLVLDEATSGLDPVARGEVMDLLLEFIQDERCGVLLSTHITTDLERVADEIAYLRKGRLLFQAGKDDLLNELAVARCPASALDSLPADWIVARRAGAFGGAALVRHPAKVRQALPDAIVEKLSLDELMEFFSGRDRE